MESILNETDFSNLGFLTESSRIVFDHFLFKESKIREGARLEVHGSRS